MVIKEILFCGAEEEFSYMDFACGKGGSCFPVIFGVAIPFIRTISPLPELMLGCFWKQYFLNVACEGAWYLKLSVIFFQVDYSIKTIAAEEGVWRWRVVTILSVKFTIKSFTRSWLRVNLNRDCQVFLLQLFEKLNPSQRLFFPFWGCFR